MKGGLGVGPRVVDHPRLQRSNRPSRVAPIRTSATVAWAGFVEAKSSRRVSTSRTGARSASAAPATSGSITVCFEPNPPPTGAPVTGTFAIGSPKIAARLFRVANSACVLAVTASVPSGSTHAVAECGSR